MKQFLHFLLARAVERSTWIGIVSIATALGIALTEFQTEAVIAAGISLAGVIAAFTGDKKTKNTDEKDNDKKGDAS
ncbi:MAG: hypothetical protein RBS08_07850 [Bdellovibrionales bacterium]|jgi:hypothetical protein|nr:hypothetical protein [Bdellovibrionales bacterium]